MLQNDFESLQQWIEFESLQALTQIRITACFKLNQNHWKLQNESQSMF